MRVACSFAQPDNDAEDGYVYVFGLPYLSNRISINTEHNIINVRLLSICPPDAIRPYFQDGYLAGTEDILDDYDNKQELDFRRRLIAKFRIPNSPQFWGNGFSKLPEAVLYPQADEIEHLCQQIKIAPKEKSLNEEIGQFIEKWSHLENSITAEARNDEKNIPSFQSAIKFLNKNNKIEESLFKNLNDVRIFRNKLVHQPFKHDAKEIGEYSEVLDQISQKLQNLKIKIDHLRGPDEPA